MKAFKGLLYGIVTGFAIGCIIYMFIKISSCRPSDVANMVVGGRNRETVEIGPILIPSVIGCGLIGLFIGIYSEKNEYKEDKATRNARLLREQENRSIENKKQMILVLEDTFCELEQSIVFIDSAATTELYYESNYASIEIDKLSRSINEAELIVSRYYS